MRIGLVSDSHGKNRTLQNALTALTARDIQAIVHCGDICGLEGLRLLAGTRIPTWLVAGNMDRDLLQPLKAAAQGSAITFWYSTVEVPLGDDQYLVATHGDHEELLDELIRGEQFPYVCHGHTHRARDVRIGSTRVICPGALADPRHPHVPTAALLDTITEQVDFYNIAHPDRPIDIAIDVD